MTRATGLALVLAAAFAAPGALAQEASSTSFVLAQSAVSSGGGSAVSSSFVLDGTAAQPAAVGDATSASFVLQSGFWTGVTAEATLRVAGSGSGRGTATGPGIDCTLDGGSAAGTCEHAVPFGTSLGVVAAADAGSRFDGWAGCDSTSTSVTAGDTCQATVTASRTITAAFTALGSIGDRVWRDVDGDGVQDSGEPGLDGVTVRATDAEGVILTTVTAGGGLYLFDDVAPGDYTVAIDPATLPVGTVPTFDADGVATPRTAQLTISDGEHDDGVDFGEQPLADLEISKADDQDPLPGGEHLVYTIAVVNHGPAAATGVTVSDVLPSATTLVATSGCAEDPNGAPSCSLGELAPGATATFTVEVAVEPAPPGSITNTAAVAAVEADPVPGNDSASEATELDDDPPQVVLVDTVPATADGVLTECETVNGQPVERLAVEFSEAMADPAGDSDPGDVTNPSGWLLVGAGPDAELATTGCGGMAGDDVAVAISSVTYAVADRRAEVLPAGGRLAAGRYRLLVCGEGLAVPTDLAGNPLDGDGDGVAGGDHVLSFRAEPDNLFANAHFDCDLGGWTAVSADPAEIAYTTDDRDGAADSGAASIAPLASGTSYSLEQCLELDSAAGPLQVRAWVRLATEAPGIAVELGCRFHAEPACGGAASAPAATVTYLGDTAGAWVNLHGVLQAPAASRSAVCGVELTDPTYDRFTAHLDQLRLSPLGLIFADGFDSGGAEAWSVVVP